MLISRSSTGSTKKRAGFTLIEVLVSMSIIVVISSIAIGYGSDARKHLTLSRTQSQLIAMVNHAKSLSQNFQLNPPEGFRICSYGFHVDRVKNEFFIFRDLIDEDEDCEDADNRYELKSNSDNPDLERLPGRLNNFSLDTEILVLRPSIDPNIENLENIVFIPPIPEVIIKDDKGDEHDSASVVIEIKKSTTRFDLRVNNFGQVTIE